MLSAVDQEVFVQVATSFDGADAGELVCKESKQRLHEQGLVWPAYGGTFRLTPAGKREAISRGIEIGPFAVLSEAVLREKCAASCEDDWDRKQSQEWFKKAI